MNSPKIRFKGFSDDWEQRKLGEMFEERIERANGDEELLSVTIGKGVIRQADSDKRNIASEDKSNYKVVRKGDVPYNSMRMWQGAVGNSEYDGIVSPAYTVLTPTINANGEFFVELFKKESSMKIFQRWSQGLTSDTWNLKYPAFSTIEFMVPSIAEQTKIAEYFYSLDNLITLHQQKCEETKTLKKYMLQKMFPQDGMSVPEIRFSGFTGDWEQRKLGELASLITKGTTPLDKSNSGNVSFVKIESIDESTGEITITQKISSAEHNGYLRRSQLRENDILFSIAGTLGRVTSVKSSILPANTNQALAIIRLKKGCLEYVKTYLKGKAVSDFIKKNPTIGAQPNLSLEQVGNIEILLPSEDEQKRIGAFFKSLDTLITLHQRKCEELRNIKKFMLQNMFV